jgi:ketosteroid isomerase-like protein
MPGTHAIGRRIVFAGLAVLPATGLVRPASAQGQPATPNDLMEQLGAAITARDADRIARFYAEQSMMMTPQGHIIHGRDRIKETFARNFASGQPAMRLVNARADGGPQAGVVIWIWELEVPGQAPPQRRRIRSMLYLKNSPSGWRVVADMFQVFAAQPG